ncbi:MAG: hypothetical protein B6D59_01950 [Campylobacteraceae bacterium 4484_4]|nr:MAG: hypothetical protein B6D59_01950 [Campylobacteraceae bacterium 4484_4]
MKYLMIWILAFVMGGCNVDEAQLKELNAPEGNHSRTPVAVTPASKEKNTSAETFKERALVEDGHDRRFEEENVSVAETVVKNEQNTTSLQQEISAIEKRYAADKAALEHDLALKKMQLDAKLKETQLENEKLKSLRMLDLKQREKEAELEKEKRVYELQLAQLQEQTRTKIAEIEAQKEREIANLEAKQTLQRERIKSELEEKRLQQHLEMAKIDKEAEAKKQALAMQQAQQDQKITMILIAVVAGLVLLGLLILYLLVRRNQQVKLRMHEEQLQKEKEMQMMELQNQRINKMLEIVSSREKLPEKVEKELLSTIREAGEMRFVIDHDAKRKKRLIFRD